MKAKICNVEQLKENEVFFQLAQLQGALDDQDKEILASGFTRSPLQLLSFLIAYAGLGNHNRRQVTKSLESMYNANISTQELDSLIESIEWKEILKQQAVLTFQFSIALKYPEKFLDDLKQHCYPLYQALLGTNYIRSHEKKDEVIFTTQVSQEVLWKEKFLNAGDYWTVGQYHLSDALKLKIKALDKETTWTFGGFSITKGDDDGPIHLYIQRPSLPPTVSLYVIDNKESINKKHKGAYVLLRNNDERLYYINNEGLEQSFPYNSAKFSALVKTHEIIKTQEDKYQLTSDTMRKFTHSIPCQYFSEKKLRVNPHPYQAFVGIQGFCGIPEEIRKVEVLLLNSAQASELGAKTTEKQETKFSLESFSGKVSIPTSIVVDAPLYLFYGGIHRMVTFWREDDLKREVKKLEAHEAEAVQYYINLITKEEEKVPGIRMSLYPYQLRPSTINQIMRESYNLHGITKTLSIDSVEHFTKLVCCATSQEEIHVITTEADFCALIKSADNFQDVMLCLEDEDDQKMVCGAMKNELPNIIITADDLFNAITLLKLNAYRAFFSTNWNHFSKIMQTPEWTNLKKMLGPDELDAIEKIKSDLNQVKSAPLGLFDRKQPNTTEIESKGTTPGYLRYDTLKLF